MAARQCHHCKQWIEPGTSHDCWTTTEAALTRDLPEDLREAWERLRETAAAFGDQRIYASHRSIMFARKACYFFVRPKITALEVCVFLGRPLKAPQVRTVVRVSQAKLAHLLHIRHRDEVEPPITDWLQEAYATSEALSARRPKTSRRVTRKAASDKRRKKARARVTASSPARVRARRRSDRR